MQRNVLGALGLEILLIAIVMTTGSGGQVRHGFPTPPEPAVHEEAQKSQERKLPIPRTDGVAMEREAKEMSALAASIPGDIELMKKGLLPSDALDKLKRIEKLSKQLRGQIHR
ncbi:MAG: hypothetical protein HY010_03130 [Acidobacteria bacterium]|nr:hypothetical protein [Acidobacteriota bacterium]